LTFLGKKRERLKNKTEDDDDIMIEHQMVRIVSQSVMCAWNDTVTSEIAYTFVRFENEKKIDFFGIGHRNKTHPSLRQSNTFSGDEHFVVEAHTTLSLTVAKIIVSNQSFEITFET
jgi:hypothetical protein